MNMSKPATIWGTTPTIPKTSKTSSAINPSLNSDESIPAPVDERFLRSAAIIDQGRINVHPIAIIGVGAIGSHLAEMLAKLGVTRMTLIDPDDVDTVNLGVQGFYEAEVGRTKTSAMAGRIAAINSQAKVATWAQPYEDLCHGVEGVPQGSVVFACVDSMKVRRRIFRDFRERDWPLFLDGRMAAESLRVFCIDRSEQSMALYRDSLFPSHEAHRESCTARATIYCATMAAAILCTQFKKWTMDQQPEPHLQLDLLSLDIFR